MELKSVLQKCLGLLLWLFSFHKIAKNDFAFFFKSLNAQLLNIKLEKRYHVGEFFYSFFFLICEKQKIRCMPKNTLIQNLVQTFLSMSRCEFVVFDLLPQLRSSIYIFELANRQKKKNLSTMKLNFSTKWYIYVETKYTNN